MSGAINGSTICKHEGREGKDPVSPATLPNYEYRGKNHQSLPWTKGIHELEGPDAVAFRSWLLKNYPRDLAKKALSSLSLRDA